MPKGLIISVVEAMMKGIASSSTGISTAVITLAMPIIKAVRTAPPMLPTPPIIIVSCCEEKGVALDSVRSASYRSIQPSSQACQHPGYCESYNSDNVLVDTTGLSHCSVTVQANLHEISSPRRSYRENVPWRASAPPQTQT